MDNRTRRYIEYRPKLEYIYEDIVAPREQYFSGQYVYEHNGMLASTVAPQIIDILDKLEQVIKEAQELSGDLYSEYISIHQMPYSHDKYEQLEKIQDRMADLEGNLALEAMPILLDLERDWKRNKKLFENTVVKILDDEFSEGSLEEKEIMLDELIKGLKKEYSAISEELAELYCDDVKPSILEDKLREAHETKSLLENVENLSYAKIDICNIIDMRYYETYALLSNISKDIYKTPQNMLDNQLHDVIYYTLDNISMLEKSNVLQYLQQLKTLLRLSLDSQKREQFIFADKNQIVCTEDVKEHIYDSTETMFLYRNKISAPLSSSLETFANETPEHLNKVLNTIVNGILQSEEKYSDSIINYDNITNTDIQYKQKYWQSVVDKQITRDFYIILQKLSDYIASCVAMPKRSELYSWVIGFCQAYDYNLSFDHSKKEVVKLF